MSVITKTDVTTAMDMVEEAMAFCARKMGVQTTEEVLDSLRQGNYQACQYVKYSLAKQMGKYLGTVDKNVKAVYLYEPDYATGIYDVNGEKPSLSSGINMIAWVDRKTAALSSLVASLDAALREAQIPLLCLDANRIFYYLDIVVVDDEEISNRRGYGAMIGSIHVDPTVLWNREMIA
jgi:hypothetical protein